MSMEGISQLDSELSYGRSVEGGKWFSSQAFSLKFLKFWWDLGRKENRRLFSMLSPRPYFTAQASDLLTFHKLVLLNLKIPKISVY